MLLLIILWEGFHVPNRSLGIRLDSDDDAK
jgi:hypothetical protein